MLFKLSRKGVNKVFSLVSCHKAKIGKCADVRM
jgi:hypothetical protein